MVRYLYVVLAMLLVVACDSCTPPPAPAPAPSPSPSPPAPPGSLCDQACVHIGPTSLDCPEGRPTPHGLTCQQVLGLVDTSGILDAHCGCIAAVRSCSEIPDCAR